MVEENKKRQLVTFLINKGTIVSEQMMQLFENSQVSNAFYDFFIKNDKSKEEKLREISKQLLGTDIIDYAGKAGCDKLIIGGCAKEAATINNKAGCGVEVVFSYEDRIKKREIQDFVSYFNSRYNFLRDMLMNRKELENPISISRASNKEGNESVALIGMINEKRETKKGNIIISLEDSSGAINVLLSKNNPELYAIAKNITLDEVLGITGRVNENIVFASKVHFPDIPQTKELKKSPDEAYAVFIGDLHFGSKSFLHEEFNKFIQWINKEMGTEEQKNVVDKVKYLFILGDLVEGVGIYPAQKEDLEIVDIYEQYSAFSEYLKKIPPHIQIIICPGNHDAMRVAEPQPQIYRDFAAPIWELSNVVLVSNPSVVNIHKTPDFPGFDILLYHGFSFPYYADNVESIRGKGGLGRADLIMKYLLQKRHLAPTHSSTQYIPDVDKDCLLIEKIPDFFVTGHIHRVSVSNYRNITLFNTSSWLAMTDYQEKVGLIPQPGRAIIVNLQSRKAKVLNFLTENQEAKLREALGRVEAEGDNSE